MPEPIDFYKKMDFNRTVYVVAQDGIEETSLGELCFDIAEETTTPHGVADKIHVRDCELWTWGIQGNAARCLERYDTNREAQLALFAYHYYDLLHKDNMPQFFNDEKKAQAAWLEERQSA